MRNFLNDLWNTITGLGWWAILIMIGIGALFGLGILIVIFLALPAIMGGTWTAIGLFIIFFLLGTVGSGICHWRSQNHPAGSQGRKVWGLLEIAFLAMMLLYLLPWQGVRILLELLRSTGWGSGMGPFTITVVTIMGLAALGYVLSATAKQKGVEIAPGYGRALSLGFAALALWAATDALHNPVRVYDRYDGDTVVQLMVPIAAGYDGVSEVPEGSRMVPIGFDYSDIPGDYMLFPLALNQEPGHRDRNEFHIMFMAAWTAKVRSTGMIGLVRELWERVPGVDFGNPMFDPCPQIRQIPGANGQPAYRFGDANGDNRYDLWDCQAVGLTPITGNGGGGAAAPGATSGVSPAGAGASASAAVPGSSAPVAHAALMPRFRKVPAAWGWVLGVTLFCGLVGFGLAQPDANGKRQELAGHIIGMGLIGLIGSLAVLYLFGWFNYGSMIGPHLTVVEDGPRVVQIPPRGLEEVGRADLAASVANRVMVCRCDEGQPVGLNYQWGSNPLTEIGRPDGTGRIAHTAVSKGECIPLVPRGQFKDFGSNVLALQPVTLQPSGSSRIGPQHTSWVVGIKADTPEARCL